MSSHGEPIRVGLVGYGAWGRMHVGGIARIPGLSLAAVLCGSDASASVAAADLPGITVYRDLEALLRDRAVDLVDIVAPNHLHAAMAVAALEAGKHVLLEKPMATTLADAERLVAAAERSGRYIGIGLELHVSKQWARVRELIAEGALGRLRYANLALFRRPFRGGSGNWRHTRDRVGSWILEEPIHYIDLLLWYFRERGLPVEVSANGVPSALGAGMYDAFTCTLRFADGAYAVFSQCLGGFEHSLILEIAGDGGALRTWWAGAMDRTQTPDFELKLQRAGASEAEVVTVEKSGEVFELEEQLRHLVADVPRRTPLVSARDAKPKGLPRDRAGAFRAPHNQPGLDVSCPATSFFRWRSQASIRQRRTVAMEDWMPVRVIGMIGVTPPSGEATVHVIKGGISIAYLQAFAQAHDTAGFDLALVGYTASSAEGFLVAQHAAQHTERLGFLIAHRPGFVAPTLAARKIATFDHLTGGRLALHIISGASDAEQEGDGDFAPKEERYRRAAEYIEVLKLAWTSRRRFDFDGAFYRVRGARSDVQPLQKPHPPLFFGGSSEGALAMGAKHCDVFAMFGEPLAATSQRIAEFRARAASYGRSATFNMSFRPILGTTEGQAWDRARRILATIQRPGDPTGFGNNKAPLDHSARRLLDFAAQGETHDERLWMPIAEATGAVGNTSCLVGTAEQVARALLEYYKLGVHSFLIRGFDPLDDTVEFGHELIPRLRAGAAEQDLAKAA